MIRGLAGGPWQTGDKAILQTLYATAMRRLEISRLNRTDMQDGHSSEGIVMGKGDKERAVFFDDESLAAIRRYLEARADAYQQPARAAQQGGQTPHRRRGHLP